MRLQEVSGEQHSGVGLAGLLSIDVDRRTHELTVVTPIPNTPADRYGLRPGDVLLKIDGVRTKGMALQEGLRRERDLPRPIV